MKKLLQKRYVNLVLAAAIVFFAGLILWRVFDVSKRITVHTAIQDILDRRQVHKAREALEGVHDRGFVVDKMKAALGESSATVWGKVSLLQTLNQWKEHRHVRRALQSSDTATKRAAAFYWHSDKAYAGEVGQIALEWVRDKNADSRKLAAMICDRLKVEEAVPDLLAVLDVPAQTQEETETLKAALNALASFKPEGLAPKVMKLATDGGQHFSVRAAAFDAVGRLETAPKDEVREFMIKILNDRSAQNILRNKAAGILARKKYADEASWEALTGLLLDDAETDGVLQRTCLLSMAETLPLDRMKELLLNRKVYNHPYFGIRIDVATGISSLRIENRVALDILCEYLVDEDPADIQRSVRQEAWLSFWVLSGIAHGVPEPERFRNPPPPLRDELVLRDYMFRGAQIRPGVSAGQVDAVKTFTGDLAEMKKIRQIYQGQIPQILRVWKERAEKERQKKKDEEEKKKDKGPQPPPKKGDEGEKKDDPGGTPPPKEDDDDGTKDGR